MPLDVKRLRRDLDAKRQSNAAEGDPRKTPSGAMAVVRAHLADIERLKAEGATWVAIAAALARQGVVLRDGRPITGRHLTGLIDSIRRQDAGRSVAKARRSRRADLAGDTTPEARQPPVSSPEPSRPTDPAKAVASDSSGRHRTAEQIRRDDLADLYDMLKGNKP